MRPLMTLLGVSLLTFHTSPVLAQLPSPGQVSLDLDGQSVVWPYAGSDLTGTPTGPVNLVFLGQADPRNLRALLRSLNGDRTAFGLPNVFPFNCTWSDAIGANETAWSAPEGWQGSAVQLQCGEYATMRVHLRLFRLGAFTLGNAHAELFIPGTSTHAILAWEFVEAIATIDFVLRRLHAPA